jgi:hypothetical protein
MSRPCRAGRTAARVTGLLLALTVLVPTAALAVPVDAYAPYQPQTRCNPTAKPGTVKLAAWLQRQYRGTGSLGISRACGHGGVSEHKEGRAFDWGVNHASARDRAHVQDFLTRIFATDAQGNPAALARRMGIMYLLWNDHIYASYDGFTKRDYLSSSCRSKRRCSDTLRHRDHVHISLSRPGGRGDTSWYHRGDPAPQPSPEPPVQQPPTPEPGPVLTLAKKPFTRLSVRPDGETVVSRFSLAKGATYRLSVAGLYGYGRPDQVADASCVWSPGGREWRTRPDAATAGAYGSLGLSVNGQVVSDTCHPKGHTYRLGFTPERTGPLRLRIDAPAGGTGRLVVVVSKRHTDVADALPSYPDLAPAPVAAAEAKRGYGLLAETVTVPADDRGGVATVQELRRGARYRITVSGDVGLGKGVRSDGICVRLHDEWYARASLDRRFPDRDHGDLYADGVPVSVPGASCGSGGFVTDYAARRTGRLRLALWDPLSMKDNHGYLTVHVQRLTVFAAPKPSKSDKPGKGAAWSLRRDWFEVDTTRRAGTRSTMKLRRGERVEVIVRGVVASYGVQADAHCVGRSGTWTSRDASLAIEQDPLELWVDGQPVRWRALGPTDGCSEEHGYLTRFTATHPGKIRLALLDLDHRDNRGSLKVTLLRRG